MYGPFDVDLATLEEHMPDSDKNDACKEVSVRIGWYHILLALVIVVTLFTRFHHLGDKPFHHDESLYGKYIWNFYTGLGYEYDPMQHGPFPFVIGQVTAFLFGMNDTTIRFTPAILGVLTVIMVLMWAPVLGRWESLAAGAIMALSPAFMYFQRFLREDASFLFNCTGLVTAVMYYLYRGQKAKYVYWTAAFYALMFATKENHFVMAFTLASFAILYGLRAVWTAWSTDGRIESLPRSIGLIATKYPAAAKGLRLFVIWFGAFCVYAAGQVFLSKKFEENTWTDIIRAYWILVFIGYALSLAYDIWRSYQRQTAGQDPGYYADATVVALAFGLFALIFVAFYTGIFTNFVGFWRSIYGWFTYWLHQHSIQRIEGPYHYYHRLLWNYENLSLVPFLLYVLTIALLRTRAFYAFVVIVVCYAAAYIPSTRMLLEKAKIASWLLFFMGLTFTIVALVLARGKSKPSDDSKPASGQAGSRSSISIMTMTQSQTLIAIGLAVMGLGFGFLLGGNAFHLSNRNFTAWNAVYAAGCIILAVWSAMHLIGKGRALYGFFIYWGTFNYCIYSYLQEKVPWLVINITLPMLLLSGPLLANVIRRPRAGKRDARGIIALVFLAMGVLYTVHSSVLLNWYNESDPTEQLVYVQTTIDVTHTMREIEQMGMVTGEGRNLPIVLQGDPTWPFYFYLRDYKKLLFSPNAEDRPAVALCDWNKRHEYAKALGEDDYVFRRRRLRHWWIPSREHLFTDTLVQLNLFQAKLSGNKGKVTGEFKWENLTTAMKTEMRYLIRWLLYREMFRESTIYGSTDYAYFIRKDLAAREFAQDLGPEPAAAQVADTQPEPVRERREFMPLRVFGERGPGRAGLTDPKSVAVAPDGSVYIADYGNSRIQKFDSRGEHVKTIGSPGAAPGQFDKPCGVAVDPQGNLLVADTWNHRVQKLTPDGEVLATWGGAGIYYAPKHVGAFPDGSVVVVDTGFHRVHILDPNGNETAVFGSQGSDRGQFFEPVGVWVTGADSFCVADTANHRLVFLNKSGTVLSTMAMHGWAEFYTEPFVSQDRAGRFLVSDSFNDRIMIYDGKGDILWYWGNAGEQPGKFNHPVGITVGPDGLAYVVDSANSRVQVFEVPD